MLKTNLAETRMSSAVNHLIALIVAFAFSNARSILVPPEKEIIYNYQVNIDVGTHKPASYASHFSLEGKLHMQYDNNAILMQLSELKYKIYNGKTMKYDSVFIIPAQEIADMSNVFRIEYKDNGLVNYLSTDTRDGKHSQHFKKNIASIMQLDFSTLNLDSKLPYAFTTEEDSIYGKGTVRYNVILKNNKTIVDKTFEVKTGKKWYSYLGSTSDFDFEQFMYNGHMSADSHKKYDIIKDKEHMYINNVTTHGAIYVYPLKGSSECYFMAVHQSLSLKEIIPIQQKLSMNEEKRTNDLSFELESNVESEVMMDLSFGTYKMNTDEYINITYYILDEALTYLDEYHLTTNTPDFKKSQAINRLHRIMGQLNIKCLDQMFTSLKLKDSDRDKKILKIFLEMIPLIGTRATTIFIRNLVQGNKVGEETAVSMLNKMPTYLRLPNEKLLIEVDDLINLRNVSQAVHQAGVLNFARLIRKLYTHTSLQNRSENFLDEYVQKYAAYLKSSNDYYEQSLYMHSLYNIRMGVAKYLEPYVKGKVENASRHLRYLAMCASFSQAIKDPHHVYEIYWPILTDSTLHLELRAGAYIVIMHSKPSMAKLWDMYWYMENEENAELYNLHYTFIKSLLSTASPSLLSYKTLASQVFNYMHKPHRRYMSGSYLIDYTDPTYGFGSMINTIFLSTNNSKSMYVEYSAHLFNLPVSNYALWFKFDGIDKSLINKIEQLKNIHINIYEIEQIAKILASFTYQKDLHIECALLQNDQIIKFGYYTNSSIGKFEDDLKYILNAIMIEDSVHISYELLTQIVMPNDIGFPTLLQIKIPTVSNNKMLNSVDTENNITFKHGDIKLHKSIQSMYDIGFYNPISNVWQGIKRLQIYDLSVPLNYKFTIPKAFQFKISLLQHGNETNYGIGLRSYATSFTYVFGDSENVLHKSSKNCHHYTQVTNGLQYRKKKIIFEMDDENTGLKYQIIAFDTEHHISKQTIMNLIHKLYHQNVKYDSLKDLLLTIRNLWIHLVLSPKAATFGLVIKAESSKLYPVTSIDISYRYHQEVMRDKNFYLPSTKINTRVIYSLKTSEDKIMKTWDINALLDTNSGSTINNFNLYITKMIPDKKNFKICLEAVKEWMKNTVKTHVNVSTGYTEDKQCGDSGLLIQAEISGQQSEEQLRMKNNEITYAECMSANEYEPVIRGIRPVHENLECIEKVTSLRKYLYNITIKRLPKPDLYLQRITDFFHGVYFPYYSHDTLEETMDKDSVIIINKYSDYNNEMDIEVMQNQDSYKLTEMPISYLYFLGLYPESYFISKKYRTFNELGLLKFCFVNEKQIFNDNNEIISIIGSDWMKIVTTKNNMSPNQTLIVYVKRVRESGKLTLRVTMGDEKLELTENEDKIIMNDTPLNTNEEFYQESWYSLAILKNHQHTIILYTAKYGLHIIYTGQTIHMNVPLYDMNLSGLCFIE